MVTVVPSRFEFVDFDPGRIAALVAGVAGRIGLPPGVDIHVEVDEASPLGHTRTLLSGRRVELRVDGGAFEDPRRIRQLSEAGTRLVLGRLLFRVADRLDPGFGTPPPDDALTLRHHVAWDAYALGRYARLAGVDGGEGRRRYAFRLRCGFSDAADRAFDRLWLGKGLTWADVEAAAAV